jgi:hypothetical protein
MTRHIAFFIVIILFSFNNSFAQDTIYWKADYKLRWEDFQGKADSNSQFGATSNPHIRYKLSANEDSFSVNVFCFFLKSKSWTKLRSDTLLIHEQGHFDIAELFARKLRKKFSEYKFRSQFVRTDIDSIFLVNNKERHEMDLLYDKETDFSRNRKKQIIWGEKLKIEMDNFQEFASH